MSDKSLVSTRCPPFLRPALHRIENSPIGYRLRKFIAMFLRKTYLPFMVIYRFATSYRRINFIKPYWGRTEFFCGLLYSDRRGGHSVDTLIEIFREKFNIAGAIIPTSSGRTAFELALRVLKNRRPTKQKVIIPTYGCDGTFNPIINAGLIPVFADIDKNLNISIDSVSRHLKEDVLAILVPHLGGCKAQIEDIVSMAKRNRVVVIEDVCQALGGTDAKSFLGTRGDMAIFSFGMGKNLMATAGGILTSNILKEDLQKESQHLGKEDTTLVKRRFRRILCKYFFRLVLNIHQYKLSAHTYSEMHPLVASLICLQLDRLEDVLKKRKENAQKIIEALHKTGLRFGLQDAMNHVYTKLSLIFEYPEDSCRLRNALHNAGIETEGMYTPLHLKEFGSEFSTREGLPYSERIYKNVFNIPVRPNLSGKQLNRILKVIGRVESE